MNKIVFLFLLVVAGSAVAQTAPAASVVLEPVREMPIGERATFNAVVRSRNDILLPATVDGELIWVQEEGASVKKGELIAKVDDRQLLLQRDEQLLLADRARINAEYLQGEVDRLSQLQQANLAAKTQLAEMASRRDLARNDLAVAKSRIAQLEETLERTRIVAPIDAIVVERQRQSGEFARRGESVARIISPAQLEVRASVPIAYLNRINRSEPVTVSVSGTVFESDIRALVQSSNQSSQTFGVLLNVPEEVTTKIAAGQFADVEMTVSEQRTSLFVPRDAVILRSEGSFVFRVDDENVVERIGVTLGIGQGALVAVAGDLNVGDRVAVRGVESLQDGQTVLPTS